MKLGSNLLSCYSARMWRYSFVARLGFCFALIVLSIVFVGFYEHTQRGASVIWIANALLFSFLLLAPRRLWPAYIVMGFLALLTGGALTHLPWRPNLLLNFLNVAEAAGTALLLSRRSTQLPQFTDRRYLLRYVSIAVLGAPLTTATVVSLIGIPRHLAVGGAFLHWATADALGMAVVPPLFIAIFGTHSRGRLNWRGDGFSLVVLAVVTYLGCNGVGQPMIFLIYPILLLITLRMGHRWGAIAIFLVAMEGTWLTMESADTFIQPLSALHLLPPSVFIQLFLAAAVFMIYSVSSVMETLQATERKLQEIVHLHQLVTENSLDIIVMADLNGKRSYVSAAGAKWGGWRRDELLDLRSMDLVHPDDRARALALVQSVRSGGKGGLLECQMQKKSGEYAWVEANIHPVFDPVTGITVGVLSMLRDIGSRKVTEEQLEMAYRQLETLAVTDSLTGLANRRQFDQSLTDEWRRCLREHKPLSLLMIDVDFFKSYNDTYGHLHGDSCLKQVAEAAQDVVSRTGDLVARFGGEEFAILLPNTSNRGTMTVAHQVRAAIRGRGLVHAGNPPGYVTLSIGCATMVPALGQHAALLIQRADDALYAAKDKGRDRVCNAKEFSDPADMKEAV